MAFTPIEHSGSSLLSNLQWLRDIVEADDSTWSQTVIRLTPADCPHRTEEDIEEQVANIPPWERAQRIDGDWEGAALDRLFEGFDDRRVEDGGCVATAKDVPRFEVEVGLTFDHGEQPGNQVALLYLYWLDQRSQKAKALVLDEYVSAGRTTTAMDARHVEEMLLSHELTLFHVGRAHGDVNSQGKSALASVNETLEQEFAGLVGQQSWEPPFEVLKPRKGPGSIKFGCRVLNAAFLSGRLLVHERCTTFIHALRNWQGTTSGDDKRLTHTIDAARYGLAELLDPTSREVREIRVV